MSAIARRGFIKGAAAAGLAVAGIGAPRAQDAGGAWPNRPVRFIVPLAPGGAIDFIARALGDVMSRSIGQQVVVENRTGAGGTIGMDMALKSAPDGYTVLITNDNAASAPHIMNLSYDYTKELVPVIYLARQSQILATHRSLGVGTVAELVDHVKANPGMGYATSGVGTNQHVIGEWFKQTAGLKLDHVPYRGAGQAINDLIAAHVKIAFLGPTALVPHYRAGTLRLLAQSSSARAPTLPEIPDPRGGRLQGSGARGLVCGFRSAWHAARAGDAHQRRALEGARRCQPARDFHQGRGRAGRRQRGRACDAGAGGLGEICAAGEGAWHPDELAALARKPRLPRSRRDGRPPAFASCSRRKRRPGP